MIDKKTTDTKQIGKKYVLSCVCCNKDIENKYISIVYYGTIINLCGNPCGIRDYLDTQ
jgi:hypothetical protein